MAKCIRLEWANQPDVKPCAIGEPADHRGLRIRAIYDDGTDQEMDVELKMFKEINMQETGTERAAQVVYEKCKLPVRIPLNGLTLASIQVIPRTQILCTEGLSFDRSQVTVTAIYSDGSSRVIDNYKIAPHLALSPTDTKITFRYGRSTCELPITVQPTKVPKDTQQSVNVPADNQAPAEKQKAANQPASALTKTVAAVSVARKPNRQKYLAGDTMVDLKGGRLDVIYNDGSVGQIDMTADGPVFIDSKKPGTGSISFTCLGKPVAFPIDVLEPKIVKLTIAKQPSKLDYEEGETLNLAGLVLDVVYNDGSVRTVKGLQSNGFVVTREHAQDGVTLSYEGEPFTLRVSVKKKEMPVTALSVELANEPNRVKYVENDPQGLDLTGASLIAQMSDGRRLTIPVTADMVDPIDLSKSGRQIMTIRYMGHTVTCSIFVSSRTLTELVIRSPIQKTEYVEGEKIDLCGLSVDAVYDNGERIPVSNYASSPEKASVNDREIQISYEGKSVSIPIEVQPLTIVLLDWARQPVKTTYYTQEKAFSCDGGILRIKMNDGSEKEVPLAPEMVSGFRTDRVGTKLLTVSFGGKTAPLSITVKERMLLGLRVVKKPRTEYTEGEEFDPSGLVVEAMYAGETTEVVGVNYLPYGPLNQDTTSVMLVYQDKAVVMPITVSSPQHHPIISRTLTPEPCDQAFPVPPTYNQASPVPAPSPAAPPVPNRAEPVPVPTPAPVPEIVEKKPEPELEQTMEAMPGEDPFAEEEPVAAESEDAPVTGKRRWANVPAFYPSTFSMRFTEDSLI